MMRHALFPRLIAIAASTWMGVAQAGEDPCSAFSWDVQRERALFATAPDVQAAGADVANAPQMLADRLYEFSVTPQDRVRFAAAPGKKMLTDGASAGLVRLHVDKAGDYRVSLDQPFWIDVVADGRLIASKDFQGRPGCQAPHKIVLYPLSSGQDLILQFSGAVASRLRVTVTRIDDVQH